MPGAQSLRAVVIKLMAAMVVEMPMKMTPRA
jgi:hypothetical protein